MSLPVRKNHEEQGYERLLNQFQDKENTVAILNGYMQAVQTTEDALLSLLDGWDILNAIGSQLDDLGRIVGVSRKGRSDASYRDRIRLQILINVSNGTPNELLEILSLLTTATVVKHWEHYPFGSIYYTNGDNLPSGLAQTMTEASPATHSQVHIIHDPSNNALIPAELTPSRGILIDNEGNEIVDNEGNNIAVNGLEASIEADGSRGVLSELDGSIDNYGIPPEVYIK